MSANVIKPYHICFHHVEQCIELKQDEYKWVIMKITHLECTNWLGARAFDLSKIFFKGILARSFSKAFRMSLYMIYKNYRL